MKIIVTGSEPNEELICDEVRQQGGEVTYVQIDAPDRFNFSLDALAGFDAKAHELIICLDSRGLNFSRAKAYMDARLAGFRIKKHIAPTAVVASNSSLGDGVCIGPMSIVGPSAKFGANVKVGARVNIGRNVKISKHVFIGDGAYIGDNVTLADHVSVSSGSVIASGSSIGRYSDLQMRREYSGDIPEMSFFWWDGIGAARVYDFSK